MTKDALPNLIADIGGTNARFALCEGTGAAAVIHDELQLPCAEYPDVEAAVCSYLQRVGETRPLAQASLAIAAPVSGDDIRMTNHHWHFSASRLRHSLSLQRLILLNDFTALAMAIRHLPRHELQQIGGRARVSDAPIALLGAGTGLGVSGLVKAGEHWLPLQGEGGHVSLAPGNAREAAVLQQLWKRFEHVSAERVLSGGGLENLYQAICALEGVAPQDYRAVDITTHALSGSDVQCVEVLAMFCGLLGSVAGDLALTLGATQAVYVGGGIVPRFGEYFARSPFRERFEAKGRYVNYLKPVPVYLIHTAQPAFVGLAHSFVAPGPRVEVT